ncbi:hypothetical protein EYC84_002331 [Monilinia fructicola]|uniref:Uncharacterized protein n=1 Tax=Monilinia fructicola TaxID=38448 RepID=A0A5M9JNK7_MONFR|nr:hypothetical protein EYC84_002331 [Monilinia fructicola]
MPLASQAIVLYQKPLQDANFKLRNSIAIAIAIAIAIDRTSSAWPISGSISSSNLSNSIWVCTYKAS